MFPVACLLASAGGLEALTAFFREVPEGSGLAFLVLQHYPSDQPSLLPELLSRHSALPFQMAAPGDEVQPNRVLVLTPGLVLEWQGGQLILAQKSMGAAPAHSGDLLFESAAACLDDLAIGAVLSGTGSDGTLGLRAIQGRGGQTFAQTPATAAFDAMPRHAIHAGVVDWVLPPAEIPQRMIEGCEASGRSASEDEKETLDRICAVLSRRTSNDFSRYKPGTLLRRLHRRMQARGTRTLRDYLAFLDGSSEEAEELLSGLLIGVTEFFRDPAAFQSLEAHLAHALQADPGARTPFRIWVPGCSTGEEAYSIAILARERLEALGSTRQVQIFGTDIDTSALLQAKSGRYSEQAVRNLSPERR